MGFLALEGLRIIVEGLRMTLDHIMDTIFRAGVFRAMHGLSPAAAACVAVAVVMVGIVLKGRGR